MFKSFLISWAISSWSCVILKWSGALWRAEANKDTCARFFNTQTGGYYTQDRRARPPQHACLLYVQMPCAAPSQLLVLALAHTHTSTHKHRHRHAHTHRERERERHAYTCTHAHAHAHGLKINRQPPLYPSSSSLSIFVDLLPTGACAMWAPWEVMWGLKAFCFVVRNGIKALLFELKMDISCGLHK